MDIIKTLIALATVVSVCIAQNTNISGTVTDSGGTAIEGADVWLEKGDLATTTGGDGSFTLSGTTGIIDQITEATLHILSATINNGLLYIHVQEKSAIKIVTYNLQGRALSAVQKTIDAGTNSIAMPLTEAGVYLHKIKAGSSEAVLKSYSIGGTSGGSSASVLGSSSSAGPPQATGHFPIHDVIAVTKNGYLNYRVIVTNSDTANIEIKMIACAGTVTDADGNVYQTVKLGNQVWTVENLRTTKYNDGTPIPHVPDSAAWNMSTTPGYCYYNNTTNADSIKKYGAFYNWYTVYTKKLAPEEWHVPDTTDWNILENYLIANGYNWDETTTGNKIAKSMATKAYWRDYITPGTIGSDLRKNNRSGFSALPSASRLCTGYFFIVGNNGKWWSATDTSESNACYRLLCYDYDYLYIFYSSKSCGFSVRLVKD